MTDSVNCSRRRVLVIDDNVAIHRDVGKILEPRRLPPSFADAKAAVLGPPAPRLDAAPVACPLFDLASASQGEEGVALVAAARDANDPFQVAFVDMRMPPGWDGLTTTQHLWSVDPRVQVVICTAYSEHSLTDITDHLGISDRLIILKKPFDTAEILQLATTLSEKWRAERAAERRVAELERMVQERTADIERALLHDKLTGLPNRAFIQARLDACIQQRNRNPNRSFALLYLDFDRFKIINDSLGHDIGDLLLIEIANRLRHALRTTDIVSRMSTPSRIGGDEFLILMEDLREESDAARVAERLLAVLGEPYTVSHQQLNLTASIGIATARQNYEHGADMVRDADTAMYRAKAAGRARYMMFDNDMHAQIKARLSLEQALRIAIRNEDVGVHFQPIVAVATGTISGFEALVRWSHPQRGPVPASELVALAEETGLIQPLSLIVLRTACAQLRCWQMLAPRPDPLMMSVNLSRGQLLDPGLVGKVLAIVAESNIVPGSLILEVTESTALAEGDDAGRVLRQFRDMGVRVHLDDFGTGYSSLSCLYSLPLSGLKIDRAFIKDVFQRPEHRVVLESIVNIARALRLQIIAEGVETTEQFELLRALGIEYAQGYLFGQAVNAENTVALLDSAVPMIAAFEGAFGVSDPGKRHRSGEACVTNLQPSACD